MLRLRPYKPCDAKTIVKWANTDEKTFRKWSSDRYGTFPITADDINKKYIDDNGECIDQENFYPFTAFDESGIVSHMIMRFTDKEKKVIRFGYIIVDNEKRGKGIGKELLNLATKYAFEILKVEKITLGVFDNNKNAEKCYLSFGFIFTGTSTEVKIDNGSWIFRDMELKKESYNQNNL